MNLIPYEEVKDYIIKYIGLAKFDGLTDEQKENLVIYVGDSIENRGMCTFRYLVYCVLGTDYDTDFLELNNSLWREFNRDKK